MLNDAPLWKVRGKFTCAHETPGRMILDWAKQMVREGSVDYVIKGIEQMETRAWVKLEGMLCPLAQHEANLAVHAKH